MKVNIYLLICLISFYGFESQAQEKDFPKWKSSVFFDINGSNKTQYTYYDRDNKIRETNLNGKGFLELSYEIDYRLLKSLSIVGTAGLTNFNYPTFASIKTGMGLKLLYVDSKHHHFALKYGYHLPFRRSDFREGHQIEFGQVFDVGAIFNERLLIGFYVNYDFFYLDGSTPVISEASRASSLKASSYGLSFGITF